MTKKFYITTAIDYVNAEPHIGHAYQKIIADVLARWNKIKEKKVFFLTGTDEHGQKIAKNAKENKKTPKEFVDFLAPKFKHSWKLLNVDFDKFIRTTDEDHEKKVQKFIKLMEKKGDIYKGEYSGLYCEECEAYITERELVNGKCPFHPNKEIKELKEETYFFKLSKYEKKLLELYEKNKKYILPVFRRREIVNRVKEGLKDLSITRLKENMSWGIPFPLDEKYVVYVWYEALLNYITGIGWPDSKKFKEFWPADVEILGIDNGWFHCVIWPAMLFSVGIKPPKTILINGFLTFNNQKISKSLGNVISPKYLIDKYGADSIRYYICRNFVFGQDGDFSEKVLVERHNNELANKLGNLVSRVTSLIEKIGVEQFDYPIPSDKRWEKDIIDGKVDVEEILNINPEEDFHVFTKRTEGSTESLLFDSYFKLRPTLKLIFLLVETQIKKYQFDRALNTIFAFIDNCNKFIQVRKLWETKDKKALYELKESILKIAELLWPFIPESSEKITKQFSAKKIKKSEILFKKI